MRVRAEGLDRLREGEARDAGEPDGGQHGVAVVRGGEPGRQRKPGPHQLLPAAGHPQVLLPLQEPAGLPQPPRVRSSGETQA